MVSGISPQMFHQYALPNPASKRRVTLSGLKVLLPGPERPLYSASLIRALIKALDRDALVRKGESNVPYVSNLLKVVSEGMQNGQSEARIIRAIRKEARTNPVTLPFPATGGGKPPVILSSDFRKALQAAMEIHAGQKRKGMELPAIVHLFNTARYVLAAGGGEAEASAALLHDAREDQDSPITRMLLDRVLKSEAKAIVQACTEQENLENPTWRVRKQRYIDTMRYAPYSVRLVSAADKLDNAVTMLNEYQKPHVREKLWHHFMGGKDGTFWFYRAIIPAYRHRGGFPLVDQLEHTVQRLAEVASGDFRK